MYPSYPHDNFAQHYDIAMRAIEGDEAHLRIQRGNVTLSLTAATSTTQTITFNPVFTPNATPDVFLQLVSADQIGAKINLLVTNATNDSFTIEAYSDQTQNITVKWLAIGKAE
jgi:hypothetical protein